MNAGSTGDAERVVATGFAYPEGPRFDATGTLHVVELAGGTVSRVVDGERQVLAAPGGSPNGAAFDADGMLWVANNGGNWGPNASTGGVAGPGGLRPAAIQVVAPDGTVRDVLTEIDGRPLDSPNDVALDPRGGLWFTDPVWATRDASGSAPASASPPGSVCFTDGERSSRCHTGMVFPNGLALTPDWSELVVGETGTGRILAFPIIEPGRLGEPRVWCELGDGAFPDGMAWDSAGRLVVAGTGSGALFVVSQAGRVDRVAMADVDVTNLCFGGPEGRDLYVTEAALGRVVVLRWDAPGEPLPAGPRLW
ncbi:SMP-30/gluconolactonase/LRE family protein [Actinotalea sp. M2MS4P-6]|uniref:SMP-30/gluconolactonase/LRE family protein n=1 Tax=Actinotalea sp. M2MS4P-6 TaxID=2983762 RepID=UPI0021E37D13|nr:SMP-30/gluconolactonase/LRE family protein [Actinotalea sp. M2MS4P-6]MCV2394358.1 SMP-30/gluconolactonase/LRE family protein [Actinotalea sp. M2MS4P-6]